VHGAIGELLGWCGVRLARELGETLGEEVCAERVEEGDRDVAAKGVLEAIQEVRRGEVALHDPAAPSGSLRGSVTIRTPSPFEAQAGFSIQSARGRRFTASRKLSRSSGSTYVSG